MSSEKEEVVENTNLLDSDPLTQVDDEKSDLFDDDEGLVKSTTTEEATDPGSMTNELDSRDLFITVSNPEKHITTMETYITYKITTKTTRSIFDNSEYSVQRRYQDFVWLRNKLEEKHETHLIPPLPSKFIMKGMLDRFNRQFTQTRCRALHNFLDRISRHSVISFDENLQVFLTAKAYEFTAFRKQSESFMSRVGGSVKSISTAAVRLKDRDPEFDEVLNQVTQFGEKIGVLERVAERLHAEKKEFVAELKEFSPTFSMWSASEDDVIAPIMTSTSSAVEACAEAAEANLKIHEFEYMPPLREYVLYCDVVKQVLRRRDNFQLQHDKVVAELQRKQDEKENLPKSDQSYSVGALMGKSANEVKDQKELKLEQQIEEISKRRDDLNDKLECANANLRSDVDRWKVDKLHDMAQIFDDLADSQIQFHQQCLSAWEHILPAMQEKDQSTDYET
nr:sorting nexin-7-like isoform X1 [Ciona intestinalis]|eukprot:XP_026691239.1 sorting nexin-7-like isoform X1 [Ciona intestinalis]